MVVGVVDTVLVLVEDTVEVWVEDSVLVKEVVILVVDVVVDVVVGVVISQLAKLPMLTSVTAALSTTTELGSEVPRMPSALHTIVPRLWLRVNSRRAADMTVASKAAHLRTEWTPIYSHSKVVEAVLDPLQAENKFCTSSSCPAQSLEARSRETINPPSPSDSVLNCPFPGVEV